jgi:23S rRNA (cytidine1920-2'-O)/16S rRNA (cytidine1409-2'-O)-methyltransferase
VAVTVAKQRLDQHLVALGLTESREQARRLIMAGEVRVDGQLADKPATLVGPEAQIEIKQRPRFVSRGGDKLDAALERFGLEVSGRVCADLGASTGGFTDVLLQRGAAIVYAIDVGHGILDYRLRTDPRVVVLERTNARYMAHLPEPVSLVTVDASFISLKLLLPVARGWLVDLTPSAPLSPFTTFRGSPTSKVMRGETGDIIALIKPQFEAGRKQVGKGGIVKDPAVHRQVLEDLLTWARANQLGPAGLMPSPIKGAEGNLEFLAWLRPGQNPPFEAREAIDAALA